MTLPLRAALLCVAHALSPEALSTIRHGGVHVEPNWLPAPLVRALRDDAAGLFSRGLFAPDGLTNTAKGRARQGFSAQDRQTFRGARWTDAALGDARARRAFAARMDALRAALAAGLGRPSLSSYEMTYNWYEPGAALGRHLDEYHEDSKGVAGWRAPTRRSVTWLVYLNDAWDAAADGGALRAYPRRAPSAAPVGADRGNLQVGWLDGGTPVFLDSFRPSGGAALYTAADGALGADFDVPSKPPFDFGAALPRARRAAFEQLDRRGETAAAAAARPPPRTLDIAPEAGKLVVFDSVSLPHEVLPVTASRQRIATTGWFHETSQFSY